MNSKGVRVLDKIDGFVHVQLREFLEEIRDGSTFSWSILYLYGMGRLDPEKFVYNLDEEIASSARGFFISWEELNLLSYKFDSDKIRENYNNVDIFDIVIIGCRDPKLIQRYETDKETYEICDVVIEKIDSNFWQVFSKDHELIEKLSKKFVKTEFLEPDFQKDFYK